MCLKCFIEIIEREKRNNYYVILPFYFSLSLYIYIFDIFYSHLIKEMRVLTFEENTEKSDK